MSDTTRLIPVHPRKYFKLDRKAGLPGNTATPIMVKTRASRAAALENASPHISRKDRTGFPESKGLGIRDQNDRGLAASIFESRCRSRLIFLASIRSRQSTKPSTRQVVMTKT